VIAVASPSLAALRANELTRRWLTCSTRPALPSTVRDGRKDLKHTSTLSGTY
jgi:hypothetical protein